MTTEPLTAAEVLLRDVSAAQRLASGPHTSVWVGASAGSGKTKVLADRVSRLLLDGVRPERILCLTFTRAAAAEMSIRLTQRMSEWATCDAAKLEQELTALQGVPPDEAQRVQARRLFAHVLACPGGMRIQTIHGFAQEVLRRFPLEAGLAPHFTVMEEADAQALWEDSLDDLLQEIAQESDTKLAQAFARLVAALGEHNLRGLLKEARGQEQKLRHAAAQAGGLDALAQQVRAALGLAPDDTEESLLARAVQDDAFDHAALLNAARLVAEQGSAMFIKRAQTILTWLASEQSVRIAQLPAYLKAFFTDKNEIYAKMANDALVRTHPEIDEALRSEAQRLVLLRERLESVRCAQDTAALVQFAMAALDSYQAQKRQRAALDFDDLIARANALLARPDMAPWVLYKLDGGIDHILVDESQDTNPAQWRVIEALANEYFAGEGAFPERTRTLFVVGDEKQSIYSFQGADAQEFSRMHAHFAARIRAAEKPFEDVPLNVSFRSAPAILQAVDAVFAPDEVRAGVAQDRVTHTAFRREAAGRVEVWPLFAPPEDEKKSSRRLKEAEDWVMPLGYETVHDPVAALADQLARQIKRWIAQGHSVYDKKAKAERAMHAGDVMVLVQTRGAFVEHFVRALKREAVPVSGVDRMRLTQQLAVMDVMALLQFALLPEDNLTLACVLRGPLIGASEEQLMELAIGREGSLWSALLDKAAQGDPTFAAWAAYLSDVLDRADQTPPLPLLVRLLNQPCPADARGGRRAIAARLGPDADDPLDELLGEAETFGATHTPSLQAFLHWLGATEAEIKREMEQAGNCVRITTVHASKGLESPIVILPDTVRVPDKNKLAKILWDSNETLPFYVPREPSNSFLDRLRTQAYARQMQEYRRLLYVAMTRAADRLYVCGFVGARNGDRQDNWYSLIAQGVAPLHQDAAITDEAGTVVPSVVLADYAGVRRVNVESSSPPLPNPPREGEGTRSSLATHSTTASEPKVSQDASFRSIFLFDASGERKMSPESDLFIKRKSDSGLNFLSSPSSPKRKFLRNDGSFCFSEIPCDDPIPSWLFAPPPPEPSPPRPLVPSRPSEEDPPTISPKDARFARGRLIHRLLQNLPEIVPSRRAEAAAKFLANPQHGLSEREQSELAAEVLGLVHDERFAPLFAPDSRAEQPVVGLSGDRLIAGQVDRLALVGDEVWIVDYKTNRPPPDDAAAIPSVYRAQMDAYRTVLQAIYPDRRVRCFLLWTYTLRLMEVV